MSDDEKDPRHMNRAERERLGIARPPRRPGGREVKRRNARHFWGAWARGEIRFKERAI